MSKTQRLQNALDQAKTKENTYDWLKAAKVYEKALGMVKKGDFLRKGEVQEKIGYCLYRSSFQVKTQEKFTNRMLETIRAYEKAAGVYGKVEPAKNLYCRAMASYTNSWIHVEASRKKKILGECEKLLKEAIEAFERAGDHLSYGRACNDLSFCLLDRNELGWDWTKNRRRFKEAIKHGQNAVSTLSKVGDQRELARAYIIAGMHSQGAGLGFYGEEKREEFTQTSLSYAEKALELSKKTGDAYLITWSNYLASEYQIELTGNLELSLKHAEECSQQATESKDSYLIGRAFSELAYVIFWMMNVEEDPDKKREGYERVMRYAEDALRHFLIVCRYDIGTFLSNNVYPHYTESYYGLALEVETDPKERRNLLERAIEVGREGLEYAEQAGTPGIGSVHHGLSKVLYSLSRMETQITEKRRLLEEASEHRQRSIDIIERVEPFFYWNKGVMQNYAALIKAGLATIEIDKEKKRELLEEAVSHMEKCIELCTKGKTLFPKNLASLGRYFDWFGDILNQLYSLTKKEEILERAIQVYESAAESYRKAELPSRVAEAYWRAATIHDQLGEHTRSERNFQSAAENYGQASEKIPQLKEFYKDHVLYMRAWGEIERARHHHENRQYGLAKEDYEKAADLHKSAKRWSYLTSNYLALARFEEAEDLSRREQTDKAGDLFQQAAKLFEEAKESIKTEMEKIEDEDEKQTVKDLAQASDLRREYCLGRAIIEEAKMLDRQGDHAGSSRKYSSAAKKLQGTVDGMKSERGREELRPIIDLCHAWQMMTQAEAEASPSLYAEASRLFDVAKESIRDEKAKTLALGHSSFCKSLEAGARFEATREMAPYSEAKSHLEAAASYYVKAGFKTASEYAKATQNLFDAYMYVHRAETESDLKKKTQYYQMAERLFQASAGSYMKAEHPEKTDQAQRLLESIKEQRELAMSLTEVLHVPTTTSTTTSFSTPTPSREQAVGLERFDQANIQANLIFRVKEVKVGDDMQFRIEIVNAGKAPALLVKVDKLVPEGFEIKEVPEIYTIEDRYIDMKGKRLNPLKTEDVKVVVTPQSKGTHVLKPRILYLDETGKYKSHEPEPVTITIKELGISGWIKGEK